MANHPSSLKRNRQSLKRRSRNRSRKGEIATLVKTVLSAPKAEAEKLIKDVQSKIDKAARKGTLHWKTAARKVAKLVKAVSTK